MRRTAMRTTAVVRWPVRWLSLCLFLFVAACAPAPTPSAITPTASGPAQLAAIAGYHGHTSTVFAVAWSPDGTHIASGGNDNTVQVWDASIGHLLVKYTGHAGTVYTLAWSPDGRRIVSGSDDSTVQVWNAKSGQLLLTYSGHTALTGAVAWSPDGTRLASESQVWNTTTRHLLMSYLVPSSTA